MSMWERTPPATWIIGNASRMTAARFESLRVVAGDNPCNVPPAETCKALIGGRWYAVRREHEYGLFRFHAQPIVVVAARPSC